jgi:hypothetical protein
VSVPSNQPQAPEANRTSGSSQRASRGLGSSLDRTAIGTAVEQLRSEAAFETDGRNSKTIVHDGIARVVVSAVDEGRDVGGRTNHGRIAIVKIDGAGILSQGGEQTNVTAGEIATLAPGGGWEFRAEQPSAMVTCFWQPI